MIVKSHLGADRVASRNPVDRSFDLAAVRSITAAGRWVVGAVQLDDRSALRVLHYTYTLDEIRIAQANFPGRRQAEEVLRRVFAKVILLDVEDARERHCPRARRRIFGVVDR